MNKAEFINLLQENTTEEISITEAEIRFKTFWKTLTQSLEETGEVKFVGLGSFQVVNTPEKERIWTMESKGDKIKGETYVSPAKTTVKFKAGKKLVESLK